MSSILKFGKDYVLTEVGGISEKEFDDIDNYDIVIHISTTPTTPPSILYMFQMKVDNERKHITEFWLDEDFEPSLKKVQEYRKLFLRKLKIESILENE